MGFFRKKAEAATEVKEVKVPCPCEIFGHIWQDFPWIVEDTYDNNRELPSQITIKEYYMCRVCHELQEKILWGQGEGGLSRKQHDEKVERIMKQYKDYVKPKPIVMDMIHDMKLVDKEKLKCWEKIHAPTDDEEDEKENDTGFLSLPELREK